MESKAKKGKQKKVNQKWERVVIMLDITRGNGQSSSLNGQRCPVNFTLGCVSSKRPTGLVVYTHGYRKSKFGPSSLSILLLFVGYCCWISVDGHKILTLWNVFPPFSFRAGSAPYLAPSNEEEEACPAISVHQIIVSPTLDLPASL